MREHVLSLRWLLSLVVLAVCLLVLSDAALLGAQGEEPCEFGGPEGSGWECDPDQAHEYHGTCEGIDCYTVMEKCCAQTIQPGS